MCVTGGKRCAASTGKSYDAAREGQARVAAAVEDGERDLAKVMARPDVGGYDHPDAVAAYRAVFPQRVASDRSRLVVAEARVQHAMTRGGRKDIEAEAASASRELGPDSYPAYEARLAVTQADRRNADLDSQALPARPAQDLTGTRATVDAVALTATARKGANLADVAYAMGVGNATARARVERAVAAGTVVNAATSPNKFDLRPAPPAAG